MFERIRVRRFTSKEHYGGGRGVWISYRGREIRTYPNDELAVVLDRGRWSGDLASGGRGCTRLFRIN